jgi:hypothetical protein
LQIYGVDIAVDGKSGHHADAFNDVVASEYANFRSTIVLQNKVISAGRT